MSSYEIITERIIEKLEAGVVPWRQTWTGGEAFFPRNLKTDRVYRGVNLFLLAALGYERPYFVTFKQAQELGGSVRKGEKGCPVIFWNWVDRKGTHRTDEPAQVEGEGGGCIPLLRHYTVFNVFQCDGLDLPELPMAARSFQPIEACEQVVRDMPRPPTIVHSVASGDARAYYRPSTDTVNLPSPERFESPESYYAVLFHELSHATGHETRLSRKGVTDEVMFGSHDYSKEELVAEMGSTFLSGVTGIEAATLDHAASYLAGWLKALRGDARLVVQAAAQAQKAADYILGRHP